MGSVPSSGRTARRWATDQTEDGESERSARADGDHRARSPSGVEKAIRHAQSGRKKGGLEVASPHACHGQDGALKQKRAGRRMQLGRRGRPGVSRITDARGAKAVGKGVGVLSR